MAQATTEAPTLPHLVTPRRGDWDTERLLQLGEYFAAGYFACKHPSHMVRMGAGLRRTLEHTPLDLEGEGLLVPCGPNPWVAGQVVYWHYGSGIVVDDGALVRKKQDASPEDAQLLDRLADTWRGEYARMGWHGHSIPHFGKVLEHGLHGLEARIRIRREECIDPDPEAVEVYDALVKLLKGIVAYVDRYREACTQRAEQVEDELQSGRWRRMAQALEHVPWKPARTFFEAVLCTNVLLYLDCDDLGRADQFLLPYYERTVERGLVSQEEVEDLLDALWRRIEAVGGWNVAIGGSRGDGESALNPLTYHAMKATSRVPLRRPNLALRVSESDPDELLEAALDTIATGRGMPALYNEELYQRALMDAHLNLAPRDMREFAFGGCTEIMIHGLSNCGSLDSHFPALQFFEFALNNGIHRQTGERRGPETGELASFTSFDDVMAAYEAQIEYAVEQTVERMNEWQRLRAERTPNLVRTLLIDDCVERGREFHAGGARYNWGVVCVGGLANIGDSLSAIRHVVFDEEEATLGELAEALDANWEGHEELHRKLKAAPKYGNDDPLPDGMVTHVAEHVFREFRRYAPWRGGKFLPSCIMFTTYAHEGAPIGATPDGRHSGDPVVDSIGPVAGRDQKGPTALLNSVTKLDHSLAPGTLILNVRLAPSMVKPGPLRAKVIDLIRTFLRMGGLQMQINVVDQETLVAARRDPESHRDLIVRVGGFSEYFTRLDPVLQDSIIERVAHEA